MSAVPVPGEPVVIDASAVVDLLGDLDGAVAVHDRLRGTVLHAPAHMDAEVLSALGRLSRSRELAEVDVESGLSQLAGMPVHRHAVGDLLVGAWARRADLRLVDALYVELAHQLRAPLLTTDHRLARVCGIAESIS